MTPAPQTRPSTPPIVAPSILSADFARLPEALALADPEREWVHCDVMDNHFVPNLTFGPIIVDAVRKLTSAWLDVHLMITEPLRLIPAFREAGADGITVHLEACADVKGTLAAIHASGALAGLAIKPGTPLSDAEPHLAELDLLLVMTVEPGFGGQAFLPEMMEKVSAARELRAKKNLPFVIEVDGGLAPETARVARAAGAEVFVAGHAIYSQANPGIALASLRNAVR